jgi:outer membrane protein assembly factor BamB
MHSKLTFLVVCLVVLVSVPACLAAEKKGAGAPSGWPQWHGPNRDGKSLDTGLLKNWPAEGPKLLWKTTGMGQGYSTVSIGGGRIYTSGLKGEHPKEHLFLTALDMQGKVLWTKDTGPAFSGHHVYHGSRGTPTYDNESLYLVSGLGLLGRYDARTGKTVWTRDIKKDFKPGKMRWGFTESLLVLDDVVIATPGGDAFMVALDKKDGKTVWKSKPWSVAHYSSPIYVEYEGVPMIINGACDGIAGVHAKTGKILWTQEFAKNNMANVPTPSFSDGYVFWAVGYGKGGICLKLSVSGEKVTAREVWRTKAIETQYGGYVIHDGYIYGNHGYNWSCLDLKTGKKMWGGKGVAKGAIAFADGMLYLFGIDKGHTALAPATPKELKLTGEFKLATKKGPAARAHPVICGGRFYLRFDQDLRCFDVKAR